MANVIEITESNKTYPGTPEADSIVATDFSLRNVTVNAGGGKIATNSSNKLSK